MGFVETGKRIDEFIDEYLDFIKINKRSGAARRYIKAVGHFRLFVRDYPSVILLSDIKGSLIEKYKIKRVEEIKAITVNYELRVLRVRLAKLSNMDI